MISRAAAIKGILSMCPEKTEPGSFDEYGVSVLCGAVDLVIKGLPSVDAVPVVRCAECKYCFDWGSDPMEPYDGESEWYCERWDKETSAYGTDPYRFYCEDGERRDEDALGGR